MKKFVSLCIIAFLAIAALPAKADAPRKLYPPPNLGDERYYLCRQDSDCVTADLPCGRVVVVNKVTHEAVQGWYNHIAPRYQCLGTVPPQKAENISCINNLCKADITQVSENLSDAPHDSSYCETPEDCAVVDGPCNKKIIVNRVFQKSMQGKYDALRRMGMEGCFWPDNRFVKEITCKENTCGAELEIPNQNYWSKPPGKRIPDK